MFTLAMLARTSQTDIMCRVTLDDDLAGYNSMMKEYYAKHVRWLNWPRYGVAYADLNWFERIVIWLRLRECNAKGWNGYQNLGGEMKFKMVLQRLKEPSTWSSIGGIFLGSFGAALNVSADDWILYSNLGMALASFALGIVFREKGEAKEDLL